MKVLRYGEAGLKAALADRPDAVVCDLAMPRLNGLQVAEGLSRLEPRPLLIAVTAFAGAYPEDMALLAGFQHYFQKPADPFAIEAAIRDHVGPTTDARAGSTGQAAARPRRSRRLLLGGKGPAVRPSGRTGEQPPRTQDDRS